jgi:hypothetical protein
MYHPLSENAHQSEYNVKVNVDVGATGNGTARLIDHT